MATATANPETIKANLAQFTGSDETYRHWLGRNSRYTSGVKHIAEACGAYWLIDAVFSHQTKKAIRQNPRLQEFQIWNLKATDGRAVLTCREDSGFPPAVRQNIEFTDFPLDEIKLYLCDGCLMLPSEY